VPRAATEGQVLWAGERIVQDYLTQVERLPDGSLWATLYGSGRRLHQEPVRTLRHGKRRAYDLLCTAVDTGLDADPSGGSAVPGPGSPVAGSVPAREPAGAVGSGPGTGSSVRDAAGAFSARAAAEAVRAAAASPSADAALQVVIQMVLRSGPWDAASISVRGPGGTMRPAASSDARAADADRLQFEVGEGPCLDAVHPEPDGPGTERLVVAVDLAIEQRWPRWGPAVTALGIRSVAVLRLFTGHTVGSISLYAQHPTGLDRKAVHDARVVAALASVVLARVTVAAAEVPTRTRAPLGRASPVMVTSVPPSVLTRAGLSEVILKDPTAGKSTVPPSSGTGPAPDPPVPPAPPAPAPPEAVASTYSSALSSAVLRPSGANTVTV